jgi:hypothetical protein
MPHTTPNRKPPSVAALIREFSAARYITINRDHGFQRVNDSPRLAEQAREMLVQQYA